MVDVEDKLCFQSVDDTYIETSFVPLHYLIVNMIITQTEIPLASQGKKIAFPIMNALHRKPIKPIYKKKAGDGNIRGWSRARVSLKYWKVTWWIVSTSFWRKAEADGILDTYYSQKKRKKSRSHTTRITAAIILIKFTHSC